MATTITLPDKLEKRLQQQALVAHQSLESLALNLLWEALEEVSPILILSDVVARIKATPPNPQSIRPAQGSLAEFLRHQKSDEPFDLTQWEQDWSKAEAEMRAMTLLDEQRDTQTEA